VSEGQGPTIHTDEQSGHFAMNIELHDIVKRFGSLEAVSHVSLDIHDGELFTLLGPSGCGKTTILRLIGGFHTPDHGGVSFGGNSVTGIPPYERNIGMVFQNYALWPHMTIFDNVAYGLKIKKLSKGEIGNKVSHAFSLVNLEGLEKRYPGQLSGGQQQRVALARALVLNPDVLLLDEPLSNLDAKIRLQVRAEIRKLQKELAITTVYVTHDQEEALTLSDRIAVIDRGRLQQVGTPWDLYERPANAFVADFIGINNLIPGQVEESTDIRGWTTVKTEAGLFLSETDARLETGDRCMICVRPETASIGEMETAQESANRICGAVSFASFIGNTIRYDVEIGTGITFRVDVQNPRDHKPYAIGDKVYVSFSAKATLAIPA
jgi:iron(III) transport system ATP-binding protein